MTTVTSTEAGASGRYISFNAAALDSLGSQTIIAYCNPSGSGGGGFGYIYGKTPTGTTTGPRLFIDHNAGSPRLSFGASSTSASNPNNLGATSGITYGNWQYCEVTWDGTTNANNIFLFVDGSAADGTRTNGSGSITSDAANDAFLMNRFGLGREFVGDIAWVAVWDRVLSADERGSARTNGPLSVPSGLVLAWANQSDLGPNGLTATTRSSFVAGGTPTSDVLGISAVTPADGVATVSATSPASGSTVTSADGAATVSVVGSSTAAADVTAAAGAATVSVTSVEYTIRSDYERASVTVADSSISGTGDSAIISLQPRFQETEAVATNPRWLEPSARIDGVNGKRPTFRFLDYASGANGYHGHPWDATRRPMFSYDRLTWTDFDTAVTLTGGVVEFRHSAAFAQNTVYISRCRQISVAQAGDWVATMASSYAFFVPSTSATSYTPSGSVSGFAAQTFIADEYSTQTDTDGNTIPVTPFYAAEINDTSLMPADGSAKRLAVVYGGNHAGEDHGEFAMRAFLENLCSSDTEAQALRRAYRVLVYPMLNAPGRAGGGWRGSFTQGTSGADDANRNFSSTGSALEIVDKPKAVLTTDRASTVPDWIIDFHGTYLNTWSIFVDPSDLAQAKFQSRLQTYSGNTIADEGDSASGSISTYFKSLGTRLAITHEAGTPAPVSDASITAQGAAIVDAMQSLAAEGFFFSTATAAAGAATVSAVGASTSASTATAAAGAAAVSVVGAATAAADVSAAAGSATVSAVGAAIAVGTATATAAAGVATVSVVGSSVAASDCVAAAGVATVSVNAVSTSADFIVAAGTADVLAVGSSFAAATGLSLGICVVSVVGSDAAAATDDLYPLEGMSQDYPLQGMTQTYPLAGQPPS